MRLKATFRAGRRSAGDAGKASEYLVKMPELPIADA